MNEDLQEQLLEEAAYDDRLARITIRDEVHCQVTGLLPFHREELHQLWSIRMEKAWFDPRFKQGIWDGTLKYFEKNGATRIRLLPDIIPWLAEKGYKFELNDKRKPKKTFPKIDQEYFKDHGEILRYYQVDATNALLEAGEGIAVLATAGGKTFISAALASCHGELKSITIVPTSRLVRKTYKDFQAVGLDIGRFYGKIKEPDHQHVVCNWQTLQNHRELLKDFQVVIVDEVHGSRAKIMNELLVLGHGRHIQYRYGMTGTMPKPKTDRTTIRCALGEVVYTIDAKRLMDEGWIANLDIRVCQLQDSLDFDDTFKWEAEKNFLVHNKKRLAMMADLIREIAKSGNTLVLVENLPVGEVLHSFLEGSVWLQGSTSLEDREEDFARFEHENNKITVATYGIMQMGESIDRIYNMVLVDAGASFIRTIQSIGRGLRKAADKHHVWMHDLCSNGKYGKRHLKKRLSYYKEAHYPYRVDEIHLDTDFLLELE